MTIRYNNEDYSRVLLSSSYTTIRGWGVLLSLGHRAWGILPGPQRYEIVAFMAVIIVLGAIILHTFWGLGFRARSL